MPLGKDRAVCTILDKGNRRYMCTSTIFDTSSRKVF